MARKRPGWFGESQRHSLASRGVRTATRVAVTPNVVSRKPVNLVWTPEDRRTISVTYEVVTPESVKEGDVADAGYEEENIPVTSVEDMISIFEEYGHYELGNERTYYAVDPERDYSTGSEKRYAVHLNNFTDAELDRIVDVMGVHGLIVDFSTPLRPRRVR